MDNDSSLELTITFKKFLDRTVVVFSSNYRHPEKRIFKSLPTTGHFIVVSVLNDDGIPKNHTKPLKAPVSPVQQTDLIWSAAPSTSNAIPETTRLS